MLVGVETLTSNCCAQSVRGCSRESGGRGKGGEAGPPPSPTSSPLAAANGFEGLARAETTGASPTVISGAPGGVLPSSSMGVRVASNETGAAPGVAAVAVAQNTSAEEISTSAPSALMAGSAAADEQPAAEVTEAKPTDVESEMETALLGTSPSKWDDWDEDGDSGADELGDARVGVSNVGSDRGTAIAASNEAQAVASATTIDVIAFDASSSSIRPPAQASESGIRRSSLNGDVELSGQVEDEEWASRLPLLCTKCDHEVIRFADSSWSDAVDYIFVRNYGGMRDKLAAELVEAPGKSAAYCCQCAWQTVAGRKALSSWGTEAEPEGGSGTEGKVYWTHRRSSSL